MLVTEWDYELDKAVAREESLLEGRSLERMENVKRMYQKGYAPKVIADVLDIPENEVNDILGL